MKKEIIQTGKTVDAAIEQACAELGLPRDEVEFEIIDLPKCSTADYFDFQQWLNVSAQVTSDCNKSKACLLMYDPPLT